MSKEAAGVLDFDEALGVVLGQAAEVRRPEVLERELAASGGWVLAEAVKADRDQPPFDRSTRDGFAVRVADLAAGGLLRVVGQVRAGELWRGEALASGCAIEIMTGAPVPPGADAVVMVEHVVRSGDGVRLAEGRRVGSGENIVLRGSEARAGETVVPVGTVMEAAEVALAAACGRARLRVFARPTVGIVATGDELVEVDQVPEGQQIRNSNSYGLAALVAEAGGRRGGCRSLRIGGRSWRAIIRAARAFDLMILSGGVSMGEYDLVEEVLAGDGGGVLFYRGEDAAGEAGGVWEAAGGGGVWGAVFLWAAGESGLDAGDVSLLRWSAAAGDGWGGGAGAAVCAGYSGGGCYGEGWVDADASGTGDDGAGAAGGEAGWMAGVGGSGGECEG